MPFENLGDKLQSAFKDLRGKGKLSESDIDAALREVRKALLEADVNFKVAKNFIAQVREKAVGEEVFGSLKPDQTVIKIVRDELTELLGGTQSKITMSSTGMTVIMLVGLQGAGKTTTAGKLALMLKKRGKRPLLAACDVYRPAAVKQLEVLGEQVDVPVYRMPPGADPVHIAGLEDFHPDRMAGRILDLGDLESLIEQAQRNMDHDTIKEGARKIQKGEFSLEDFLKQLKQIQKLGSMSGILSMIPGMGKYKDKLKDIDLDGKEVRHIEAIILSMTPAERANIDILNGSRRKRIADGAGVKIQEVNRMMKQFKEMQKQMKKMKGKKLRPPAGGMGGFGGFGGFPF